MKNIFLEIKFLKDIIIYPISIFKYLFRRNKRKFESVELGNHWKKALIESNFNNWRGERARFIKCDNENYIRYILKENSKKYNTILDIGSYDGYFFDDYSSFNQIICADVFIESQKCIQKKFNTKFDFILLNGYDFSNIKSGSIDFVFSMHTLNRIPKKTLIQYFRDINRITSKKSSIFLHIPDCYNYNSINNNFTFISARRLKRILSSFEISIDYTISTTSTILMGQKNK